MKEEDVIALNSEAMRYCQLHKFKKSIKCLEKAIKLEPKFALLWHSKGLVFTKMAVELVNDQIRMQKSGEAKEQHHHYAKLKLEEALECYDKAIELNPKDLKTWHNRGDVLEKLGILSFDKWFFQSAIECCDKVIELGQTSWESVDPNDNDGWDPKGIAAYEWMTKGMILYIHLGRRRASFNSVFGMNPSHHNEAIKCFDKAIELNPKDANVWKHKGDTLVDLAEHGMKPSVYVLEEFKDPKKQKKRIVLAQFSKYMEAAKCYEKVIKLDPVDENAWITLGDTCIKLWNLDPTRKNKLYDEFQDEDDILHTSLFNIMEESWDENDARDMYGDSEHGKSWDEREKIWDEKPDVHAVDPIYDKAIECLKKVTKMDPLDSIAWTKLGYMYTDRATGDQNKAVECLRKAVKLDPENAIAWYTLTFSLDRLGRKNESSKCFDKAIELNPSLLDSTSEYSDFTLIEKQWEKNNERWLSERFVIFHYGDKEQKEEYEKLRLERKLSDDLAKIEEICRNCSLTKRVLKSASDFYQSIDEDFEQVEWKDASLLGAPRSYEILKTRKSEMLKRPPFAATIVYIACKMCDATHSIEKILQKICYPKKVKSKAIQDAKKYYDILLTDATPTALKIKQFESREEYLDFMKEHAAIIFSSAGSTNQVKKYPPELKKKS